MLGVGTQHRSKKTYPTKYGPLYNGGYEFTPAQQKFINVYNGNIKESAKLAGISVSYAQQLTSKPQHKNIQEAIRKRYMMELRHREAGEVASRRERQVFWTNVMRGILPTHDPETHEQTGVEPVDANLRIKASELLGRSEGDFIERKVIGFDAGLINQLLSYFPDAEARIIREELAKSGDIIEIEGPTE